MYLVVKLRLSVRSFLPDTPCSRLPARTSRPHHSPSRSILKKQKQTLHRSGIEPEPIAWKATICRGC
jgi:hypothetical protein